jgi:hypothetical protein
MGKKFLIKLFLIICISSFFLFLLSCTSDKNSDQDIILQVGQSKIFVKDFRNSYELDPGFPGIRKGTDGLREFAEKITDKILCEKLAQEEGVVDSIPFKRRLNFRRNETIIRSFYEEKVKNKVQVSESEIKSAYLRMSVKLHVKHLFAPDKLQAENLYRSLEAGVPFDTLAGKVFAGIPPEQGGPDLGMISWGDLNPSLEDVIYNLKPGEYSKPVSSPWGYHILLVTNREQNLMITDSEYREKHDQIERKLRKRKEGLAAGDYLKNYLDPFHIKVKKEAFSKIIQLLHIDFDEPTVQFQNDKYLSDQDIEFLRKNLKNQLDDPFLVSNKLDWTIGEFLNKIDPIPWDKRPRISSALKLKEDIGILIRNEFILNEALKNGINNESKIDSVLKVYTQELAYNYYLRRSYQKFELPSKIAEYYENRYNKNFVPDKIPDGILPGMNTPETYKLYYSERALHQQLLSHFQNINIKINDELIANEAEKIDWEKPVRMFVIPEN